MLSASVAPAWAFQPTQDRIGPATGDTSRIELQIREQEQRMLRAQEEHRLNLEQDRETMRYRPEELRIPRAERNCQRRVYGNKWLKTTCR